MKFILIFLGILFVISGIFLLFSPEILSDTLTDNLDSTSLYAGVILFRAALGILLVWAAKLSKFPKVIAFFGYLAVLAAITFILIGHAGFQDFISSILPMFSGHFEWAGLFVIAFGGFLIYAFSGKEESGE